MNINLNLQKSPKVLLVENKADLKNEKWLEEFIVALRRGDSKKRRFNFIDSDRLKVVENISRIKVIVKK